jgi:hypothetical protein
LECAGDILKIGQRGMQPRGMQLPCPIQVRSNEQNMSLNDLEFAYAPVRNQVRDLREYL